MKAPSPWTWESGSDGTATFAPSPAAFLSQLRGATKFVIQTSPYGREPIEATFSLQGIDKVAASARSACPS
jgi:hypothetical protein